MTAIAHAFAVQTTVQTVTGTTFTTVLSLASSNFVADGVYLVEVQCTLGRADTTVDVQAKTRHGTTDFADSAARWEAADQAGARVAYRWFTRWTAVASEGIDIQIACDTAAVNVTADQITIMVMRLDVDLVENTDYVYAEVATDTNLSLTPLTNGASVTFTPTAGDDWLVKVCAQHDVVSVTASYGVRIFSSGTFNQTQPSLQREGENAAEQNVYTAARVFLGLGAVGQTFREESFNTQAASGVRLHSKIFALRLNAFRNHVGAWTEAEEALGTTDWADPYQVGISLTPDVAGDVWLEASMVADLNNASREATARLQVDDVDQPGTQTSDIYLLTDPADVTDEIPVHQMTIVNLSAAAHTFDWEGDADSTTGAPAAEDRHLCAFTMELPEAGGGGGQAPRSMHQYRQRRV